MTDVRNKRSICCQRTSLEPQQQFSYATSIISILTGLKYQICGPIVALWPS